MPIGAPKPTQVTRDQQLDWELKGYCFQYNRRVTIPDNGTARKYFLFDPSGVPDDKTLFVFPLRFFNVEDGPCFINYSVGHNYTGGTPVALLNRNGNSSKTADVVVYEDPTGSSTGLITSENKIAKGGALPSQYGGGDSGIAEPFIASNELTFLIETDNQSGGAVTAEVLLIFCEVPNSEL